LLCGVRVTIGGQDTAAVAMHGIAVLDLMPQMLSPPGAEVVIDGRPMLYFAGTAYFALQGEPRVIDAAARAMQRRGLHPATSRSGFGESSLLVQVEELAARFFGAEAALVVASGYAGPSVMMQCAPQGLDLILLLGEPERHDRLRANADRLRRGLRRLGLAVADWPTPIVFVQAGNGDNMARPAARALRAWPCHLPFAQLPRRWRGGCLAHRRVRHPHRRDDRPPAAGDGRAAVAPVVRSGPAAIRACPSPPSSVRPTRARASSPACRGPG
jgi:hypothetical protein